MSGDKNHASFQGISIVSCGVLRPELTGLQREGFLNVDEIFFTAPGLHETPKILREQLFRQIGKARRRSGRVIAVYGRRCYLDFRNPLETIGTILEEAGDNIAGVEADNCVDLLAGAEERAALAAGSKVYWLTMGWLLFWKAIFRDWDPGKANETFPQHDKAVLLDPFNAFPEFAEKYPERVLEFSDWMRIPIEPGPVPPERLKGLLLSARKKVLPEE